MCAAFECPSGYGGAKECLGEGKEGHCDLQMPMHLGWVMPYRKTASLSAEVPNFLKGVSGISHDKLKTMDGISQRAVLVCHRGAGGHWDQGMSRARVAWSRKNLRHLHRKGALSKIIGMPKERQ